MEVYTTGFTKKTAEQFFDSLSSTLYNFQLVAGSLHKSGQIPTWH